MKYKLHPRFCGALILTSLCTWALNPTTAQVSVPGAAGRATTTRSSATARTYQSNTQLGDAMISSDPETRKLIIITDDETNVQIKDVIANLDHPKPQVLIKVVFVEATIRDDLDLGVEGKYTHRAGAGATGTATSLFGLASQTSGGFYKIMHEDLDVTIRALAEAGKTEVLSRPSILVRNNQTATITVGQEVPFITNSRITDQGQTINTIQYQDVGIILRVTPFITSDGLVEMIVAPEISGLTDKTIPISETVSVPVISKRSAETVVLTEHGKTVVIGGLMENQKTKTDKKVPLLGDIPLVGLAFKRKITQNSKTELLIFLTPYVVQRPGDLAQASAVETSKSELVPKSFSEKDLDKFLDGLPMKQPESSSKPAVPRAAPQPTGRMPR